VQAFIPSHHWSPWLFQHTFRPWWFYKTTHRLYLDFLTTFLHYTIPEDWYQVRGSDIFSHEEYGRSFLRNSYNSSPSELVRTQFVELKWIPWCFSSVPRGFWKEERRHLEYLEWLKDRLNIERVEDWYGVTFKDIKREMGEGLLRIYYHNSPAKLIMKHVKNVDWEVWRFGDGAFWGDDRVQSKYFVYLGKELGCNIMEDWQALSNAQLAANMPRNLRDMFSSCRAFVEKFSGLAASKKVSQKKVKRILRMGFDGVTIHEDYAYQKVYHVEKEQERTELDLFLPSLALAFEYQGEQHFVAQHIFPQSLPHVVEMRDFIKVLECLKGGITLLCLDFWEDHYVSMLRLLSATRPDLSSYLQKS